MLNYNYICQTKYTEAILSSSTRKPLWFEITKMLIADLKKNKFTVSFIVIFGILSSPINGSIARSANAVRIWVTWGNIEVYHLLGEGKCGGFTLQR